MLLVLLCLYFQAFRPSLSFHVICTISSLLYVLLALFSPCLPFVPKVASFHNVGGEV